MVLALLILLVSGLSVWYRFVTPSDLAVINTGERPWPSGGPVLTADPGVPGGLRQADRIVAVDGRSIAWWVLRLLDPDVTRPTLHAGSTLIYQVEREDLLIDLTVVMRPYPLFATIVEHWSTLLLVLLLLLVGVVVFVSRSHDPAAQAALLLACLSAWAATAWVFGLEIGDLVTATGFWRFIGGQIAYALLWGAILHFVLVFPRMHRVLAGRRSLVWLSYSVPFALHGFYLAVGVPRASDTLERIALLASPTMLTQLIFPVFTLLTMIYGYRAITDTLSRQRVQLLVITLAAGAGLYLGIWVIPSLAAGQPLLPWEIHTLVFLPCPIAIGIAVLRYQAFDIDVIVNRTLLYGFLTTCVVGLYMAAVGLLSTLFNARTNFGIALTATGLVAVVFHPLRERLQRTVNRLLYGYRDQPYEALSELAQRLEITLVPDRVLAVIVETIAQALHLPYAAVELKHIDAIEQAAVYGDPIGHLLRLPLTYQGETIGWLVVAPRGPAEAFSEADLRLLKDLARHAGVTARAVQLSVDLQRSRERLVNTREEERRRLRRDLHDGLGPTLAAIALGLEAAREAIEDQPAMVEVLERLQAATRCAVTDIRRLVEGLRPPALDQLGLVSALRALVASLTDRQATNGCQPDSESLRVTMEMPTELPDLPAAVEVAVYRIAAEALTNTIRHSSARYCSVRLTLNGALELEIVDDGMGLPPGYLPGVGLTSMRERAVELGGTLIIAPEDGGGTSVRARFLL